MILKYFRDLDFKYYIYIYFERESERQFYFIFYIKKNRDLSNTRRFGNNNKAKP